MKKITGTLLSVLVLMLMVSACSTPPSNPPPVSTSTAVQVPTDQAPTELAAVVTETRVALIFDDFSDPTSGWEEGEDAQGIFAYDNGSYHMTSTNADAYAWSNANLDYADVVLEVDIRFNNNLHQFAGVVCRMVDKDNYYVLEITSRGEFIIRKYQDGQWTNLVKRQMQTGYDILTGEGDVNRLTASCTGSQLTLAVNGETLAQVTTADEFSSGDVGMISGTFDDPGGDVSFDNFKVTAP